MKSSSKYRKLTLINPASPSTWRHTQTVQSATPLMKRRSRFWRWEISPFSPSVYFRNCSILGLCGACSDRAGGIHPHRNRSFHPDHLGPRLLRCPQRVPRPTHCLWNLSDYHISSTGALSYDLQKNSLSSYALWFTDCAIIQTSLRLLLSCCALCTSLKQTITPKLSWRWKDYFMPLYMFWDSFHNFGLLTFLEEGILSAHIVCAWEGATGGGFAWLNTWVIASVAWLDLPQRNVTATATLFNGLRCTINLICRTPWKSTTQQRVKEMLWLSAGTMSWHRWTSSVSHNFHPGYCYPRCWSCFCLEFRAIFSLTIFLSLSKPNLHSRFTHDHSPMWKVPTLLSSNDSTTLLFSSGWLCC